MVRVTRPILCFALQCYKHPLVPRRVPVEYSYKEFFWSYSRRFRLFHLIRVDIARRDFFGARKRVRDIGRGEKCSGSLV